MHENSRGRHTTGGDVLDAGDDEGAGLQAESTDQGGDDGQCDQGDEGGQAFAHDTDRDDHPLAHQQPLTLADLSGQTMILTGRDSSVRDQVERVFYDHGLRLVVRAEANYMSTVLALVQQGLGISLLPESAAQEQAGVSCRVIDGPQMNRDPHIPTFHGHGEFNFALDSVALTAAAVAEFDAVVLATDHDRFDYGLISQHAKLIIDSRGKYREPAENVVRA